MAISLLAMGAGKIPNQGGRDNDEKSALGTISNRADGTKEPDSDAAYGNAVWQRKGLRYGAG